MDYKHINEDVCERVSDTTAKTQDDNQERDSTNMNDRNNINE
jgi:hypothetical protein